MDAERKSWTALPALADRAVSDFQSLFEFVLCRPRRHYLADCLETEHQSLNSLQQVVVQLARDTHTLVQARFAGEVELFM